MYFILSSERPSHSHWRRIPFSKFAVFLDLDTNLLTGTIPTELGTMGRMQSLRGINTQIDLSGNVLEGRIPIELVAGETGICE